ncbi:MAG: hypothetical protein ACFCBW_04935 [Candidatus Competibacterales bacterium]
MNGFETLANFYTQQTAVAESAALDGADAAAAQLEKRRNLRNAQDSFEDWLQGDSPPQGARGNPMASFAAQSPAELVGQLSNPSAFGPTPAEQITPEEMIKKWQEDLQLIGDDTQLANIDLQSSLQKQQQITQIMANLSKVIHDTMTNTIRKIG